ncbi:T-box protein 2 [Frankliniella fusca]|uniref:T-box protein 2 n=1 Tax=Frankliniella fusca TaxID=407009 RepID=A0AAE1LJM1_9NEOP|nr:T-box protein 2 [Frankliniella fusca]
MATPYADVKDLKTEPCDSVVGRWDLPRPPLPPWGMPGPGLPLHHQAYMLPVLPHYALRPELRHEVRAAPAAPAPLTDIKVTLQDRELWDKFHRFGNEMIITKTGRRMFPSLKVKVSGMEPDEYYFVVMEMRLAANTRFKYSNGQWVPGGEADVQPQSRACIFVHPDSPAKGSAWGSREINFQRPNPHGAKLTNNVADTTDYNLILTSMHKYVPVIHVVRASDRSALSNAPRMSASFKETEFVAVTAYQNEAITKMKIDHNPFAKGFREEGMSRCRRKQQHKKLLMGAKEYLAQDDSRSPPPSTAAYLDDSGVSSLGSEPASPSCSLTSSPPPADASPAPTPRTSASPAPFLSILQILEPDYRPLRTSWSEEPRRVASTSASAPTPTPTPAPAWPHPVMLPLSYPWYGAYHSYPYPPYPALTPLPLPQDSGAMDLSRSKEYGA